MEQQALRSKVLGYMYVSIPFYNHQVFKFHGIGTDEVLNNGMTHLEYYSELYKHTTPDDRDHYRIPFDQQMMMPEQYEVIVLPGYLGDRIFRDGTPKIGY